MHKISNTKDVMRNMKERILEILFPSRCPICDSILPLPHIEEKDNRICKRCEKDVFYIKEPICKTCGRMISIETKEQCSDCEEKKHLFEQGKAAFLYQGEMKKSLYRFKYANRKEYANFYGEQIARQYGDWILKIEPQVLIPIPLHKKRFRKRGYNQAYEVAKVIGGCLNIAVDSEIMQRKKNTIAQKQLSMQERKKNLNNAFFIAQNNVKYNCIILIDDIYTTGSTIDEASLVLKRAGVKNIYFICISIGKGL